jgi:hypothetical protein
MKQKAFGLGRTGVSRDYRCLIALALCLSAGPVHAQPASPLLQAGATVSRPGGAATVPQLIKFAGTLRDRSGAVLDGVYGVTFSIYRDETGGAPLWMETQNVQAAADGAYSVMLGATKELPVELFRTGEPRWLSSWIQLPGEQERARAQLVSVPFALKASDADTLGGVPLANFVLRDQPAGASATSQSGPAVGGDASLTGSRARTPLVSLPKPATVGAGYIPVSTGSDYTNSSMYQAASGNIGVGTTSPSSLLHVNNDSITLSRTGTWPVILDQSGISTFTITNGGSPRFAVDGNGHVGIGTTTPSNLSLLHLYSPALNAPWMNLETAGAPNGADIGSAIRFVRSVSSGTQPAIIMLAEEPGWNDSVSFVTYGAWNRIINFQSNGIVSIGFTPPVTTPTSMLTVNGMVESRTLGFKFPDGTIQTTAAGALSFSSDHAEALKSQGEAVKKLESQNAALQQQIADLRAALESLRQAVEKGSKEK